MVVFHSLSSRDDIGYAAVSNWKFEHGIKI